MVPAISFKPLTFLLDDYFCAMVVLASLWQQLIEWDRAFFIKLNSEWTNSLFDNVMPFFRTSNHWLPLYLFLLVFALVNFKNRGWWWFVLFLCTIAIADLTGNYLFKHNIQRLRPCSDPEMIDRVRLLVDRCGAGFSFVSNHATNHFAMAAYFYFTFRKLLPSWAWIGWLWAALIAYAQVYVGVHFPLDVIAGAALGTLLGMLVASFFNRRFGFTIFDNQPTAIS